MITLHISHSWGGGLTKWVNDFASAQPINTDLILTMYGDSEVYGKEYKLINGNTLEVLEVLRLNSPITDCDISHDEYFLMLDHLLKKYAVDRIIVSTLIGH